jgi:DNA polymerase-1
MIDFQALVGDASDNIPGIAGVGPKTAAMLLQQFGSLDNIFANPDQITPIRLRERLVKYKEDAYISKKLSTLKTDLILKTPIENLVRRPISDTAHDFFSKHGFGSIIKRWLQDNLGSL